MGQQIELDSSIYERLLRRSTSFEDTAEDVIRRLLDQTEEADVSGTHPRVRRPAQTNTAISRLPEREYWVPILRIVDEAGGSAPAGGVIEELGKQLEDAFHPGDRMRLMNGEVRWRNRARFARLRMKELGLLSASSHRGLWEITAAGREYLNQHRSSEAE